MKLRRVQNHRRNGSQYGRWLITVPPRLVEALGWAAGDELHAYDDGDVLVVHRAASCKNHYRKYRKGAKPCSPSVDQARDARIRSMHTKGMVDREIAGDLGVSIATVCRSRKRMGLAANGHRRKREKRSSDTRKARRLHAREASDEEIAALVGVSRESITKWRRSAGLPRNARPGPKSRTGQTDRERRIA